MGLVGRWLTIALAIWGIPAALLWMGAGTLFRISLDREIAETNERLESRLTEFSIKCDVEEFFRERLFQLFHNSIKTMPAQSDAVKVVVEGFLKELPKGMVDIFLFDGHGGLATRHPSTKPLEEFFEHVRFPWTIPLSLSPKETAVMSGLIPSPEPAIRNLKGRPGRMIRLGGTQRFSFGYFDWVTGIQKNRLAGILVFVHLEAMPPTFLLDRTLERMDAQALGYMTDSGARKLPESVGSADERTLERQFQLQPGQHFRLGEFLWAMRRLDQSTQLIAAAPVPGGPISLLLWLFLVYSGFSFLVLRASYRSLVMDIAMDFSLRPKILAFYSLAFALPIVAAWFISSLYLYELRAGVREEFRTRSLKRLIEIDSGFQQYVWKRLFLYRRMTAKLTAAVRNPARLKSLAGNWHRKRMFDHMHIIASEGGALFNQPTTPSELRIQFQRPRSERLEAFQSYIDRGFSPSTNDIVGMNATEPVKQEIPGRMGDAFGQMIRRVTVQAGEIAMEQFNIANGTGAGKEKSKSSIAFESMLESEAKSLMQAARTRLGDFLSLEGSGEYGMAYLDVLPGPTREAWYAVLLFNNLLCVERDFFDAIFSKGTSKGAAGPPMKKASERQPEYFLFPDSTTSLSAISFHVMTPNFPSVMEFKRFPYIQKLLDFSAKTFSTQMTLEGKESSITVLKCSFLKHYAMVAVTREEEIEAEFQRIRGQVQRAMAGFLGFGILLAVLLVRRFLSPIGKISEGLDALAEKDFNYRIPVHSQDELGRLCSAVNDAIERLQEMEVARIVQADLLPRAPMDLGNYELVGFNIMTQSVGGDYYDFFPLREGLTAVILGDVSGHGVSAALVTAMAKAAFGILCNRFPEQPEEVMRRINLAMLNQLNRTKMMTAFLGILDVASDRIMCANAGQSYPLLIPRRGKAEFFKLPSVPLGIRGKLVYKTENIDLKGKTMVLYSDGLIEAVDEKEAMFGYEAFAKAAEESIQNLPTDKTIEGIFERVREHTRDVPWGDDASLILIRAK